VVATDSSPRQMLAVVLALAVGLAVDVRVDLAGQALIGAFMWALMLACLTRYPACERHALIACLTIATAGELVLSLVWGLYTYRLGNIPAFVPPGHVLLFLIGSSAAQRITAAGARCVFGCAGVYAAAAALLGFDMLSPLLLLVIAVAWFALPGHRRLYAGTFTCSLVLEIYGTWLGVWSWAHEVPGLALTTTNPPGIVGAFYCALDALVATATVFLLPAARRLGRAVRAA
jgi:hypothetical protein